MSVTGAVHVYVQKPPMGRGGGAGKVEGVHAVVGPVKAPIVVLAPPRVSAEGVTLVKPPLVLLVTVITNVAVSPEKWQVVSAGYGPLIAMPTLNGLTLNTFDVPLREGTEAPVRTSVTL